MEKLKNGGTSMKEVWYMIQMMMTSLGAYLGLFFGGYDGLLVALVIFTVIDYITGVMCAIVDQKLSSHIGFKGIFRKVLIFMLVGLGHTLDKELGNGAMIRTAVIFFYLSNEGVSLLENATRLGLPVPEKLSKILEQLHTKEKK